MQRQYFFEQVVLDRSQRKGYSLPDLISKDEAKQLIDTIEKNSDLNAMVFGDEGQLPGSSKATAADIWRMLSNTPIGSHILNAYPEYKQFRISSVSSRGDAMAPGAYSPQRTKPDGKPDPESTSEFDRYDKWANDSGYKSGKMPSFKEYITDSQWRPDEVSGAGSKQAPVNVATLKQTPVK